MNNIDYLFVHYVVMTCNEADKDMVMSITPKMSHKIITNAFEIERNEAMMNACEDEDLIDDE